MGIRAQTYLPNRIIQSVQSPCLLICRPRNEQFSFVMTAGPVSSASNSLRGTDMLMVAVLQVFAALVATGSVPKQ